MMSQRQATRRSAPQSWYRQAPRLGAGPSTPSSPALSEAADRFGVAHTTVKTQLQSIFTKTDTNRQAELLRLLLKGLGGVRLE